LNQESDQGRILTAGMTVEDMFLERWYCIEPGDAQAVLDVVSRMTDRELLDRPHLLTGAVIATDLLGPAESQHGGDRAELLERYSHIADAAGQLAANSDGWSTTTGSCGATRRWLLIRMIAARWRGDFNQASALSERLAPLAAHTGIRELAFPDARDELARPGQVSLQRGLTALLAGNTDSAMRLFTKAHRDGGQAPYRHFAGVNASANAAMLSAIEGHDDTAEKWLERVGDPAALPAWCRDLTTLGATIASTVLATDVLDLDTASRHADHLVRAGDQFELWPFQLYALTQYDLARKEPILAYQRLKQVGFERGINIAVHPIADHIVFRAYLDALVAGGEGGIALRLAEDLGNPLRSLVPVARTHLLAGNEIGAARVSARAMRRVLIPIRDMWEAAVIHAIARMRLGDSDAALRSFSIVTAGAPASLPSILARQRAQDVHDLYSLAGLEYSSRAEHMEPVAVDVPALTSRERAVLQHLVDGRTSAEIAEKDFTSLHTVKTHIKRIYKKLGVSSRAAAVAIANQQGLVRWHHNDGLPHSPV